jgi:hypothetical protein
LSLSPEGFLNQLLDCHGFTDYNGGGSLGNPFEFGVVGSSKGKAPKAKPKTPKASSGEKLPGEEELQFYEMAPIFAACLLYRS